MLIVGIFWGFFEGFNYYIISRIINERYPSKLNLGAILCAKARSKIGISSLSIKCTRLSLKAIYRIKPANVIIYGIASATGLDECASKELFSNIWLLTHGIACTIATNQYPFNEDEFSILPCFYKS